MKFSAIMAAGGLAFFATAAIAGDTKPKTAPDGEKLICKRSEQNGSLIPGKKQCYTRAQWDRLAESGRATSQRILEDSTARPSGQ